MWAFGIFIYSWLVFFSVFFSPPPILDSVFPVRLSLSVLSFCLSRSSSCMRLSWQPCRYLQGPSTAPCPSPTWQQEHTRLPVARARRAGAAHRPRPRYDFYHILLWYVTRHASMLCCPLYILIMCTREMCLCPGKKKKRSLSPLLRD